MRMRQPPPLAAAIGRIRESLGLGRSAGFPTGWERVGGLVGTLPPEPTLRRKGRWLWLSQPIEYRQAGWSYGDGHRVDVAAAGQIKPLAGAQAVSLGLENPTQMIGWPRDRERFAADAGGDVGRIIGGVGV